MRTWIRSFLALRLPTWQQDGSVARLHATLSRPRPASAAAWISEDSQEFKTSKFFCKTDFDMNEIGAEEKNYANYKIPKFYSFGSTEEKERILYKHFLTVNAEVKSMIAEIQEFHKK